MSKVIDLVLSLPPSEEQLVTNMKAWVMGRGERGVANYRYIFGEAKARGLGLTFGELERMADELSPEEFDSMLRERVKKVVVPLPQFVEGLDEAGVEWGVIEYEAPEAKGGVAESELNNRTAEIVAQFPRKFVGQAIVNPHDGMQGVRELERAVKELGLKTFYASPFRYRITPNDKKFYPLYAKAVELGIPVFIYITMNYSTALPMDIAHPRYLDEVAMDFPEMTIITRCGGWPWIPEMIGVARRHQNIYIDFESHRPKYLATPGSGWEMLMQFGNTLLQDRVLFASGWANYFPPSKDVLKQVIQEVRALPLKEEVKEKWLYKNAARLFHRD